MQHVRWALLPKMYQLPLPVRLIRASGNQGIQRITDTAEERVLQNAASRKRKIIFSIDNSSARPLCIVRGRSASWVCGDNKKRRERRATSIINRHQAGTELCIMWIELRVVWSTSTVLKTQQNWREAGCTFEPQRHPHADRHHATKTRRRLGQQATDLVNGCLPFLLPPRTDLIQYKYIYYSINTVPCMLFYRNDTILVILLLIVGVPSLCLQYSVVVTLFTTCRSDRINRNVKEHEGQSLAGQ